MKPIMINERIKSLALDLVFITIFNVIISSFFDLNFLKNENLHLLNRVWVLKLNLFFCLLVLYFLLFDFFYNGISLGKRILDIKVVNNNHENLLLKKRIFRTLLKLIFVFTFLFPFTIIYYFMKDIIVYDEILKTKTLRV